MSLFKRFQEILLNIPTIITLWTILIVVDNPLCHWNERNILSCENKPAIEYKDGSGIYLINGVKFDKEVFDKVVIREEDGGMSYADRLAIVDVDQRTQAINPKFASIEWFIKQANGVLLDEVDKKASNKKKVNYKLYKFPKWDIFQEDAYYCYFDCPSTRKKHLEWVEKFNTVAEAMAWSMSDDISIVTPEEWLALIPLVDEN